MIAYYYHGLGTFLEPSAEHENKEIRRVVRGVTVDIVNYPDQGEAQKQIEEASHVYMWDWRKEDILGHEVYTGYLLDLDRAAYSEAYLAWVEGDYYFQLIAIPAKFEDYSDKQFLYLAAREVAESIMTH